MKEYRDLSWTEITEYVVLFFVLLLLFSIFVGCQQSPHQGEASWSIQGKDDAIDGCPGRYPERANVDGRHYVIGCWGDAT